MKRVRGGPPRGVKQGPLSVWGAMWSAVVAPLMGFLQHGKLGKKMLALTSRKVSNRGDGAAGVGWRGDGGTAGVSGDGGAGVLW